MTVSSDFANRSYVSENGSSNRDLTSAGLAQNRAIQATSLGCVSGGHIQQSGFVNFFSRFNPNHWLSHVNGFLTHQESARLALAGKVCSAAMFLAEQAPNRFLLSLPLRLGVLPPAVASVKFGELLVHCLRCLPLDHPTVCHASLHACMRHLGDDVDAATLIQMHEQFARILSASSASISPGKLQGFFTYLATHEFATNTRPWIVIRALQAYQSCPQLDSTGIVTKAIETYLAYATEHFIEVRNVSKTVQDQQITYRIISIDLREWFGNPSNPYSLFHSSNDGPALIPSFLSDALFARIQAVNDLAPGLCQVDVSGSAEAEPPRNFMLPLAAHAVDMEIFVSHKGSINGERLPKPQYGWAISLLSDVEFLSAHERVIQKKGGKG